MDTEPLEAQLRAANAKIREAQDNRNTALAEVTVKQSEFDYADKQYKRSKDLVGRGAVSEQERDVDLARADASRAALMGAKAQAVQNAIRDRCRASGSRSARGGNKRQHAEVSHQGESSDAYGRTR